MHNPFESINARLEVIENLLVTIKHETLPDLFSTGNKKGTIIFNLTELCDYIGLCKQTVYKKTYRGLIPHSKRGKKLFFDKEEIDRWLMENSVKSLSEIRSQADRYVRESRKKGGRNGE